jgi:hypothetical protein
MRYVAYHKDTTRYLCNHPGVKTDKEAFESQGAAKAAITREAKRGAINAADFLVANNVEFFTSIEKTETVKNIMSGKDVEQRVNTPFTSSVASETYWCS